MIPGRTFFFCIAALTFSTYLFAIHRGADDLPYSRKVNHPLDQPVNEALNGKSFLMNLGPTGIRARIDPDAPKALKVMYVFQDGDSPAKGLVEPGDMIVGANGKRFQDAHGFHRKRGGRGWTGPPFEVALAIEDSQGEDGKLELIVLKGGDRDARETVTIQLEPVGRFSETWPWNCPRSEKLLEDLLDFVFEDGVPRGRPTTVQCLLALWASGDKRAKPLVKKHAERLMKARRSPAEGGMVSWMWGYAGIFLGEYYHAYNDSGVKPAVEALLDCYERGMDYRSGGFSHRPFAAIQQRVAGGGPKGYGAMAGPGGLSMLAQSLFKAADLPVADRPYSRTHQAYLGSTGQNRSGTLAYGFGGGWSGTLIRLKTPDSPCDTDEGFGYQCPTGMKDIGDFVVEKWFKEGDGWNKKLVPPTGEFSWLKTEADNLLVYKTGHYLEHDGIEQRMVIRPNLYEEPTKPYENNHRGGGHVAPVGMGALAHFIGNKGNDSWNYLGKHMATGCAYSPHMLWDGHACAEMHAFFGILGASRADEEDFRHFLDYTKTWIILSETHDGQGLIEQPFGCQRNSTCSVALNRKIYTYNAILLLSLPKRTLLMTGADYAMPAAAAAEAENSSVANAAMSAQRGRKVSDAKREPLLASLKGTLAKMSAAGRLRKVPISLTVARGRIWLESFSKDGSFRLRQLNGEKSADFKWERLKDEDFVALAKLVARLLPASGLANGLAAVFLEDHGSVRTAAVYFDRVDKKTKGKLEWFFE